MNAAKPEAAMADPSPRGIPVRVPYPPGEVPPSWTKECGTQTEGGGTQARNWTDYPNTVMKRQRVIDLVKRTPAYGLFALNRSLRTDYVEGEMSTPRAYDNIGSNKWDKVMYEWKKMLQESFEELNRSHADGAAVPEPGHAVAKQRTQDP